MAGKGTAGLVGRGRHVRGERGRSHLVDLAEQRADEGNVEEVRWTYRAGVRRVAAPRPVARKATEAGPDRIESDVTGELEEVRQLLAPHLAQEAVAKN